MQRYATPGATGDFGSVRDHYYGAAMPVQVLEQRKDFVARSAVERSGRLVGQDQRRIIDDRSSDGDPLLLSS